MPIAIGVAQDGDEPTRSLPEIESSVSDRPAQATADKLVCTPVNRPTNFPLYSLGAEFEGLPLTAILRSCGTPEPVPGDNPKLPDTWRLNSVSYVYGDCEIPAGEGGCGTPLTVQVIPACERNFSMYDDAPPLQQRRAVPSAAFPGRVELYTDTSTVVVFSMDQALGERAAAAVQPVERGTPPDTVQPRLERTTQLPPPAPGAVSGALRCSS